MFVNEGTFIRRSLLSENQLGGRPGAFTSTRPGYDEICRTLSRATIVEGNGASFEVGPGDVSAKLRLANVADLNTVGHGNGK